MGVAALSEGRCHAREARERGRNLGDDDQG
jgi:hypothetical protein